MFFTNYMLCQLLFVIVDFFAWTCITCSLATWRKPEDVLGGSSVITGNVQLKCSINIFFQAHRRHFTWHLCKVIIGLYYCNSVGILYNGGCGDKREGRWSLRSASVPLTSDRPSPPVPDQSQAVWTHRTRSLPQDSYVLLSSSCSPIVLWV